MKAQATPSFSVVLPAYNEGEKIGAVVRDFWGSKAREVIVVDDGSTDGTGKEAGKAGARIARHKKNLGKGAAIRSGIKVARSGWVLIADSDGQHSGKEVGKFLGLCRKADFINGSRFLEGGKSKMPLHRRIANLLIGGIFRLKDGRITDPLSGMRMFRKEIGERLKQDGFLIDLELAFEARKAGAGIAEVPISARYFNGRRSKLTSQPYAVLEYAKMLAYCVWRAIFS